MKKHKAIQWTKEQAASEFGINPRTLSNRLRIAGIEPKGRFFTTQDICRAVFGDIDGEKLRLVREQADKIEIENQVSRRELIPAKPAIEIFERTQAAAVTAVQSCAILEQADKNNIIERVRDSIGSCLGFCQTGLESSTDIHSESVVGAVPIPQPGV